MIQNSCFENILKYSQICKQVTFELNTSQVNQVQQCQLKNKTILEDAAKAAVAGEPTNTKEDEKVTRKASSGGNKPMVFSRICTFTLETVDHHSFLNWKRHFCHMPCQENKQRSP